MITKTDYTNRILKLCSDSDAAKAEILKAYTRLYHEHPKQPNESDEEFITRCAKLDHADGEDNLMFAV